MVDEPLQEEIPAETDLTPTLIPTLLPELYRTLGRIEGKLDDLHSDFQAHKVADAEDHGKLNARVHTLEKNVAWAKGLGSIGAFVGVIVATWQGLKSLLS